MNRRMAGLGRLLPILVLGLPVLAQGTQSANINGEVVDKNGHPVPGARVVLSSPAMQGVREYRTDEKGRFGARLLPPGEYKIQVSKEGLETRTLTQRVGIEQSFTPRITLTSTAAAVVEVVSSNVAVDKSEFKSAQNYTKETIDSLPITRGTLLNIVYLSPGVVENASESRGGVSIRGSMGSGNLFLVDGQNVNDNLYQGARIGIIFDSIEETQVLTGALPAEYGDVEGGVVNSISKGGGDEFTGSIRWDLFNPGWNAVKPHGLGADNRESYGNNRGEERSIQLDGPIIKNKLWFHAAYYDNHPRAAKTTDGRIFYDLNADPTGADPANYIDAGGSPYQSIEDDYRREMKLTWAINQDHTLIGSYHNYKNTAYQNYGAGEFVSLTNLVKTGEFWNVAWRSVWSPNLTSSVRYGEKKQVLGSLPMPGSNSTDWVFYSADDGLSYHNTLFNPSDPQPDARNNRTFNGKVTLFLEAAGSHQIDTGLDWYEGTTKASGDQGPATITGPTSVGSVVAGKRLNQWWVDIDHYDPVHGQALAYDSYFGEYVPDECKATTIGLYLNDKWTLNKNWLLQIGVRADTYDAKGQFTGKISSATSLSPRLGVKWDILGDSTWVAGLSYARYNGRMLETVLQNRTYVNNSKYYAFSYIGPSPASFANMQNVANYDFTVNGLVDYSDAALNIVIPKDLKPQTVDEIQASMANTFRDKWWGSGYAKLTFVSKKWGNLIDYRAGLDGTVTDAFGTDWYNKVYFNNPDATRKYQGLELEVNTTKGAWSLGGFINWSSLKGNFVGEGAASPGRGQGLSWFTYLPSSTPGNPPDKMYDPSLVNPDGYLPGHTPLRMRWTAMYSTQNSLGKQSWGFLYRFDSGAHWSDTRSIRRTAINTNLPSQFGSSATQYLGERGSNVFQAQAYLDLSVQQDFEVAKIANRAIAGFLKLDVRNVLNHQQQVTWDTTYNSVPRAVDGGSYLNPWVQGGSFGQATGPQNYGDAREIRVSMGVKF